MGAPCIRGGYTSLLLGDDQDATTSTVSQLRFDGLPNNENI
jgi:hypothetical protein